MVPSFAAEHSGIIHTGACANMRVLAPLIVILLPYLCQTNALTSRCRSASQATNVAFFPRGGAIGGGRKHSKATDTTTPLSEENIVGNDDSNSTEPSFDIQEVSNFLVQEEVAEIKESQRFLQKQQRRRELDETWLDKAITSVVEFIENLFRWKVIDV